MILAGVAQVSAGVGGAYQVSLDVIVGIKALIPFREMMFYC